MKIDIVCWAKNGERYLPTVLAQVNKVIPGDVVNRKILVDDKSVDNTVKIAESFGWKIIPNEGAGVSDGANTALKYVETDWFLSIEQDVVLANDFWCKTVGSIKPGVAVISGVRFDINKSIKCIDEFSFDRYQILGNKAGVDGYLYGRTIDNTLYCANAIWLVGGFPKLEGGAGVDTLLSLKIAKANMQWVVNYNVVSDHLRRSLMDTLKHYVWYGRNFPELERYIGHRQVNVLRQLYRFIASPARGVDIAMKKKRWQVMFVYPLVRFCILVGIFQGMRGKF
jgi:glycosyltransferase involved in cell wall biosynthesis